MPPVTIIGANAVAEDLRFRKMYSIRACHTFRLLFTKKGGMVFNTPHLYIKFSLFHNADKFNSLVFAEIPTVQFICGILPMFMHHKVGNFASPAAGITCAGRCMPI